MAVAKKSAIKTNKKAKPSKLKKIVGLFNPRSLKGGTALFALVFAVSGGGYYVYRSFAATPFVGSKTHIVGQVPCSPTFNSYNGNGYAHYRDANGVNHYITFASPNYEILLYCGGGGLGQVEYRNVTTGSTRTLIRSYPPCYVPQCGSGNGVGDIGVYPLPGKGFGVVSLKRWYDLNNQYYTEGIIIDNYDIHGTPIDTTWIQNVSNSNISKISNISFGYYNGHVTSGGTVTQANGEARSFDTYY